MLIDQQSRKKSDSTLLTTGDIRLRIDIFLLAMLLGYVLYVDLIDRYRCPPNQVLAVYDQELSFAIFTRFTCLSPTICGDFLTCIPSFGACAPAQVSGLSFLQEVSQASRYAPLGKGCCTYSPRPEDYIATDCSVMVVRDKVRRNYRRQKREADGEYGSQYSNVRLVNDLARVSNGFAVNACTLQCRDDTTTRRPTTQTAHPTRPEPQEPQFELPPEPQFELPPEPQNLNNALPPRAQASDVLLAPSGIGAACFSGDSSVQTPSGSKKMRDLKLGDPVLVISQENYSPTYQSIEMWYHRLPTEETEFLLIKSKNHSISISPNHLLPILDCEFGAQIDLAPSIYESKFAYEASAGQCLVVEQNGRLTKEEIISVETEVKIGIFSPITAQGTLLVDGVYVSCFANVSHRLQLTFYSILRQIYSLFDAELQEIVDIPLLVKIMSHIANLVLS